MNKTIPLLVLLFVFTMLIYFPGHDFDFDFTVRTFRSRNKLFVGYSAYIHSDLAKSNG